MSLPLGQQKHQVRNTSRHAFTNVYQMGARSVLHSTRSLPVSQGCVTALTLTMSTPPPSP